MPSGQYTRNKVGASERPDLVPEVEQALNSRAAETRRERRRRDDAYLDGFARHKLSIPRIIQDRLDAEGKIARWVMDQAGRQLQMQSDDWDVTPNIEPIAADRVSGDRLVLMEKFKDWHDADLAQNAAHLDAQEKALVRGQKIDPQDKRDDDVSYVPEGNSITRKSGL